MICRSKSKYKAKKAELNGMTFDSKKEARRYRELAVLEQAGIIRFVLIPSQREPDTVGKRGRITKGKLIERECVYVADFVYIDERGERVVEDTKGYRTPEYIIKRKLMLWVHGIRIREK